MKKIRAAVVGYGNIGKFSVEALEAAPDFEIAGVVRRQGDKDKPLELEPYEVVDDIQKLSNVDVAILATRHASAPTTRSKSRSWASTPSTASTCTISSSTTARSRWRTTSRAGR